MEELNEKYVTVEGTTIRYIVRGTGPSVLLIHGFGEFLEIWSYNIAALSEYFTVYAIDLPGHGRSEESKCDYTLAFAANFVVDFMDAMGIQRTSVVGHSVGGVICLSMTIDTPNRIDKLVLVDSGGFSKKAPLIYRLATLPLLGEIVFRPTVKALIRVGMNGRFCNPEVVTEEWVDMAYKYLKMPKAKNTLLNIVRSNISINGMNPELIVTDKLHLVRSPTLLIHGMQDTFIPVQHAQNAYNLIPHAMLKVIDECGHIPQMEKALEFNEAVLAFLRYEEP